jgi:hypothetical protein
MISHKYNMIIVIVLFLCAALMAVRAVVQPMGFYLSTQTLYNLLPNLLLHIIVELILLLSIHAIILLPLVLMIRSLLSILYLILSHKEFIHIRIAR